MDGVELLGEVTIVAQQSHTMVTTTKNSTIMSSHSGMPDWREMQSSQLEELTAAADTVDDDSAADASCSDVADDTGLAGRSSEGSPA